ncbi:MAG: DMT family transporter, partial [Actinobacteria bacterium]|nr:DMT family transporter [Actinomycetota bacterium]
MSESLPKSIYYEKVSVPSRAKLDFLAIISGVMIAAQARANGELSAQLGNSLQAAFLSFSSGLIIIIIISIFSRRIKNGLRLLQKAIKSQQLPRWRLLAGT